MCWPRSADETDVKYMNTAGVAASAYHVRLNLFDHKLVTKAQIDQINTDISNLSTILNGQFHAKLGDLAQKFADQQKYTDQLNDLLADQQEYISTVTNELTNQKCQTKVLTDKLANQEIKLITQELKLINQGLKLTNQEIEMARMKTDMDALTNILTRLTDKLIDQKDALL
jgi:uncharacterized coiled-coil protein SlyX